MQVLLEKLNRCEADLASAVETKQYTQCASLQQELHDLRSMRLRFIRKMLKGESALSLHQLVMRIHDMETELKRTAERGDFTRCDTLQKQLKEIKAQWQLRTAECSSVRNRARNQSDHWCFE